VCPPRRFRVHDCAGSAVFGGELPGDALNGTDRSGRFIVCRGSHRRDPDPCRDRGGPTLRDCHFDSPPRSTWVSEGVSSPGSTGTPGALNGLPTCGGADGNLQTQALRQSQDDHRVARLSTFPCAASVPCIIRSAPSAPVAGQRHEVLVAATPRRISSPHNKITSVSAVGAGQRPPWLNLGAYWA
jgi:hypothetical protein